MAPITQNQTTYEALARVCADPVARKNHPWTREPFVIVTAARAEWSCATGRGVFVATQGRIAAPLMPPAVDEIALSRICTVVTEMAGSRTVDLAELRAFAGAAAPLAADCAECKGTGKLTCQECGGKKFLPCRVCEGKLTLDDGGDAWDAVPEPCYACAAESSEQADGKPLGQPCGRVACEVCSSEGQYECPSCDDGKVAPEPRCGWIFGHLFDLNLVALAVTFCPMVGTAQAKWSEQNRALHLTAVGTRIAVMPLRIYAEAAAHADEYPSFGEPMPGGEETSDRNCVASFTKLQKSYDRLRKAAAGKIDSKAGRK